MIEGFEQMLAGSLQLLHFHRFLRVSRVKNDESAVYWEDDFLYQSQEDLAKAEEIFTLANLPTHDLFTLRINLPI